MPLITTRSARFCEATRRALEVGPEDGGVETIFRVVGDPDRLFLCFMVITPRTGPNIPSRLDYFVRSGQYHGSFEIQCVANQTACRSVSSPRDCPRRLDWIGSGALRSGWLDRANREGV